MRSDDTRHGSIAGYMAHRRDDEEACIACKASWRANVAAYRAQKRAEKLRAT